MSMRMADCNLLFGVLALQNDFISREDLIAALSVWLQDKSRSLEQILKQRNAIPEDEHALLVALCNKHLERHNNDVEKSLASLSSISSLRSQLKSLGDQQIDELLSSVSVARQDVDPFATVSLSSPSSVETRFRILRPHAKGGLGEVLVAEDGELKREVALKQIQNRYADDPDSRSRFVLEAELTGGLEHPGIVPVYGLGQYADGRPFYAMRFIRGDSLKDAIERFHHLGRSHHRPPRSGAGSETQAARDTEKADFTGMDFRGLLQRFIDVCNALQYAHSRGVLHRDLKPGNIMLGKFGETLVVDWGLAKAVGRSINASDKDNEATLRPSSGSSTANTQVGSVIGTPAYMSPEQAAGKLDELGPGSDVYSLGATLYSVLTGRPPFMDGDMASLLRRVQNGDFPRPCEVVANVPAALQAVCLKAMARRSTDRYASPRALADDLERFLADEPVVAFAEPVSVRVRRWVRKHQTLATTAITLVMVSTMGLFAFSVIVGGKNQQLAQLNASLQNANTELSQSNQREHEARVLSESNERSAREQSQFALSVMTSVIEDIQKGLARVSGSGEVRRRLLKTSLAKLNEVATRYVEQASVDHNTVLALHAMGDVVLQFGAEDAGPNSHRNNDSTSLTDEQQTTVELANTFYQRAFDLASKLVAANPNDAGSQRDLATSYLAIGDIRFQRGQVAEAQESYRRSLEIGLELIARDPSDSQAQNVVGTAHSQIGGTQLRAGQVTEAKGSIQNTLKIFKDLATRDPSDAQLQRNVSHSHRKLGDVELRLGQVAEALASYQEALASAKNLLTLDPGDARVQRDVANSHESIGIIQLRSGQVAEAITSHQLALGIRQQQAAADPSDTWLQRDVASSCEHVGDAQLQAGNVTEALQAYHNSLEITENLAAADPSDAMAKRDVFVSHKKIGDIQERAGQLEESLKSYQRCLEISQQLAVANPGDVQIKRDLATTYDLLADVLLKADQAAAALLIFQKALEERKKLAATDIFDAEVQRELSGSYYRVASVHLQYGHPENSLELFQKGLEVALKLAAADPTDAQAQRDLADWYTGLGDAQRKLLQTTEALASYDKGLQISQKLAEANPSDSLAQNRLSVSYERLANLEFNSGQVTQALESYQKCLAINKDAARAEPNDAHAQFSLYLPLAKIAACYQDLKQFDDAISCYQQALEVLQRMRQADQLAPTQEQYVGMVQNRLKTCENMRLALGPWDTLLEQSPDLLPELLWIRGVELLRERRTVEAIDAVEKLRGLKASTAEHLYKAACVYSLCAAVIVERDGPDLTVEKQAERDKHLSDAVAALKQAIAAGFTDIDRMQKDPSLTLLYELPEFQVLLGKESTNN